MSRFTQRYCRPADSEYHIFTIEYTMIRSKFKMGLFLGTLALLAHLVPGIVDPARAQGSRKDDIVFNSRGVPLAGATIRVCAMPATGQPCTPLAQIYSDAALTQALANPTTSDGLGNYFFYAAPGKYEIEVSGPGITTKQIPNVILPSDPSSPTFNNLSTTGNISAFRSEEHTSELQSRRELVCRLLLEKKKKD